MTVLPAAPAAVALGDVVLVNPLMTGYGFKRACRERGLRVVSLYTLELGLLSALQADYTRGDDLSLYAHDAETAEELVGSTVRAVVPTTEPSIVVADRLGGVLGVPGNPAATALARRNKAAMRLHAVARGIPVPAFEAVATEDVPTSVARVGYPAIVKPATGAGAQGIALVAEAEATASLDLSAVDTFGSPICTWLVERYVRGRELAVNTFSQGGRHRVLDVWEYCQPSDGDYDQPYWDVVQLSAEDPDLAAAADLALRTLDAYEVELGPAHVEVKVGEDGAFLIEIATRLPGAHMVDHWERNSAIRPFADTLAAYLGEDTGLLERDLGFDRILGVCCLRNDDRPGTVASLTGAEELAGLPGVDDVFLQVSPGDTIPLTRDLGSLLGFVLVSAPGLDALRERMSFVRSHTKLEFA
ncbi:ATP-grasp domain-containing protein [Nocardiopsis sp. CT-R113]|uniref:ATP-grasp domain-containing protein n=1 Tax=Nocardiopsis codii TaxID=3065942 RepID=A0ABU7K5Y8_9ACTN|nr:ATP-grasp domain-containing protein [Nocardiopsis sp. CT-R113]MEE2037666.1 ATP-grasp domain-containing protein [Nocardiopsis sp. CT-R113]